MKNKLLVLTPLVVVLLLAMAFVTFAQEKVNTKVFAYAASSQGISLVLQGTKGTCTNGARALLMLPEDIVLGCWTMTDAHTVHASFEDGTEMDVPTEVFKIVNKDAPKNFSI